MLDSLLSDFDTNQVLIRCRRPQVRLWAPESSSGTVMTSSYTEIRRRKHGLLQRQGRIDRKMSWQMKFKDLQGFTVSDATQWFPDQFVGTNEVVAGFDRVLENCECDSSMVTFFHDAEAALRERHTVAMNSKNDNKTLLSSQHLVNTVCINFPVMNLRTTSTQWLTVHDVFMELLFATDSLEQENTDRLQTLKYNSWLSSAGVEARVSSLEDLQRQIRWG